MSITGDASGVWAEEFSKLTSQLKNLIDTNRPAEALQLIANSKTRIKSPGLVFLLEGVALALTGPLAESDGKMRQAKQVLADAELPACQSLYSALWVNVQRALSRRERGATAFAYTNYKSNLKVLKKVDPKLADEVQAADWPEHQFCIELWEGLYLFDEQAGGLLILPEETRTGFDKKTGSRTPIGIGAVVTGQEAIYCLRHRYDGFMTMARAHYVFESDVVKIKTMLHLADFSENMRNNELFIFGGSSLGDRIAEVFGSYRYPPPPDLMGFPDKVKEYIEKVDAALNWNDLSEKVRGYYKSAEYRVRLKQIQTGKLMPRILVVACRWTTFLQYCCTDFMKAFELVGCECRYLIEEADAQCLLAGTFWKNFDDFQPDAVFMASHARPSWPFMPEEIPCISFIQDKCQPLLGIGDLTGRVGRHDLFACMMTDFQNYLTSKKLPVDQTFIMPVPGDEKMFYPLDGDFKPDNKFSADVGFVKHGQGGVAKVHAEFVQKNIESQEDVPMRQRLREIMAGLYNDICLDAGCTYNEEDIYQYALERIGPTNDELRHNLRGLMALYNIMVYCSAWRFRFLEALDEAGVDLALYGGGWQDNDQLAHLDRGPVKRDTELNQVYNFNRINLSIHHTATMHQRLTECGLAGGFMMITDHPPDRDWEPARKYFEEDKELVFFASPVELIDKTRYYLAHPDERAAIAVAMHQKALKSLSCRAAAETLLIRFRELLGKCL